MKLLGEVALNNLYIETLSPVLRARNCIATAGNKSIIESRPHWHIYDADKTVAFIAFQQWKMVLIRVQT